MFKVYPILLFSQKAESMLTKLAILVHRSRHSEFLYQRLRWISHGFYQSISPVSQLLRV
jgi:hypothetical protein